MIVTCSCGFRGKDRELIDGACPRCGNDLGSSSKSAEAEEAQAEGEAEGTEEVDA